MMAKRKLTDEERTERTRRFFRQLYDSRLSLKWVGIADNEGSDPLFTVQNGCNRLTFNLGDGCRRVLPHRRGTA